MGLTADLPPERRARVDARLQTNLMAWLTTVSPAGRPDTVPVWFLLRDDDSILVYSQPGKPKLSNVIWTIVFVGSVNGFSNALDALFIFRPL